MKMGLSREARAGKPLIDRLVPEGPDYSQVLMESRSAPMERASATASRMDGEDLGRAERRTLTSSVGTRAQRKRHCLSAQTDNACLRELDWYGSLDASSGQILLTLSGHTGSAIRIAFSLDGQRLATASGDGSAKIWDVYSGKPDKYLLPVPVLADYVYSVVVSAPMRPNWRRRHRDFGWQVVGCVCEFLVKERAHVLPSHRRRVEASRFSPGMASTLPRQAGTGPQIMANSNSAELATFQVIPDQLWGVAFQQGWNEARDASADGTARLYPLNAADCSAWPNR